VSKGNGGQFRPLHFHSLSIKNILYGFIHSCVDWYMNELYMASHVQISEHKRKVRGGLGDGISLVLSRDMAGKVTMPEHSSMWHGPYCRGQTQWRSFCKCPLSNANKKVCNFEFKIAHMHAHAHRYCSCIMQSLLQLEWHYLH